MSTFDPDNYNGPPAFVPGSLSDPMGAQTPGAQTPFYAQPPVSDGLTGETPAVTEQTADASVSATTDPSDPLGAEVPSTTSDSTADATGSDVNVVQAQDPDAGITPAVTDTTADAAIEGTTDNDLGDGPPTAAEVTAAEGVEAAAQPGHPESDQTAQDKAIGTNAFGTGPA
jgi:hypothetical protein